MGVAKVERRMPEDDCSEEFVRRRLRDDHGELAEGRPSGRLTLPLVN